MPQGLLHGGHVKRVPKHRHHLRNGCLGHSSYSGIVVCYRRPVLLALLLLARLLLWLLQHGGRAQRGPARRGRHVHKRHVLAVVPAVHVLVRGRRTRRRLVIVIIVVFVVIVVVVRVSTVVPVPAHRGRKAAEGRKKARRGGGEPRSEKCETQKCLKPLCLARTTQRGGDSEERTPRPAAGRVPDHGGSNTSLRGGWHSW